MMDARPSNSADRGDQPGKTRTWWHPLLARLLDHVLATAYTVLDEVLVGKMPLRVDILLIRREDGRLSEAAERDLSPLLALLNRFTLIEFKGPTDALEPGDLAQLIGCAFLWHSQQQERVSHREVSLVVLAPGINEVFREEVRALGCNFREQEPGIFRIEGLPFAIWLVETDEMAKRGQPILSLVSRVFLNQRQRIIEELKRTGHGPLLWYVVQQIQQFRTLGEEFAMQHKDTQYMGELDEELQTAVLDAIPPEKILRRFADEDWQTAALDAIPPEKLLRRLTPEQRLRGLSPEDRVAGLSEEELARLRDVLERKGRE